MAKKVYGFRYISSPYSLKFSRQYHHSAWLFLAAFLSFFSFKLIANTLTLAEAERLAIRTAPELQRLDELTRAYEEQAVAAGQLPDPQLTAGAVNVPTNTFSLTETEMTMEPIGIQQRFPRGHSLALKSAEVRTQALEEQYKKNEQTLLILRKTRETWLELYFWTQALKILKNNQTLYIKLLKITDSLYSTGKVNQSDVIQTQLELSRLNDQAIQIKQQLTTIHAKLERWIGTQAATRPLILAFPKWETPPSLAVLQTSLIHHPLLKIDATKTAVTRYKVAFAKEQYKPKWTVNVGYAKRQGKMSNGMTRSDLVGTEVMVDLPFFPAHRQDKKFRASVDRLNATKLTTQIHYRNLLQRLTTYYATWRYLKKRELLYTSQLIPKAHQNTKASLFAYQNAKTELTTLLRSYSNELNIKLEQVKIKVARAKARVGLLYLEGKL